MTPQQIVAGWLSGVLLRLAYGVRFTDMSPFRAIRLDRLRALGMSEQTFGWNLEMQMRVAAAGWRIFEIPVDHRRRRGGVSKVSGNFVSRHEGRLDDRRRPFCAWPSRCGPGRRRWPPAGCRNEDPGDRRRRFHRPTRRS